MRKLTAAKNRVNEWTKMLRGHELKQGRKAGPISQEMTERPGEFE
jgi:hypothetical protein